MKCITMILLAILTFALLVYLQSGTLVQASHNPQATRLASYNSITPATQKADAPVFATPQDAQEAIQQGILGQIAAKASKPRRNYPSAAQVRNIQDPKMRSIVERGLNLLKAGKAATRWNATQLREYAGQVDQFIKEAEAAKPKGQGPTPQEVCHQALENCNHECRAGGGGYWCFFDCRLEYLACVIGTVTGTTGSIS
jgi:hypothetical protein